MLELCIGFLLIGMLGFGGLAASGFYVIVERNKWLTRKEYVELFGICSVLPGGNILNMSIMLGDRYRGPLGSVLAISSLMLVPLAVLMALAVVYDSFSHLPDVKAAAAGAASAVAGLAIGAAGKMAHGLDRTIASVVFGLLTFIAIAILRVPLAGVVITIGPLAAIVALVIARKQIREAAARIPERAEPRSDG